MTRAPVVTGRHLAGPTGAHDVVAGRSTPEEVRLFLAAGVPEILTAALTPLLPSGLGPVRAEVTRAKLKPGRSLAVGVDVTGDEVGSRPAWVTWGSSSAAASAVTDALVSRVTDAQRRPFSTLALPPDASGMRVLLAPVDPAFPQLVDVYDPVRLARVLGDADLNAFDERLSVAPVRYRPGQRHVVLVESADAAHRLFAKCYRDDAGRRSVEASTIVAEALSRWGGPTRAARAAGYSASHRVAFWAGHGGTRLSRVISTGSDTAAALATRCGAALRAIHEHVGSGAAWQERTAHGAGRSDPAVEAGATRRAVEHVAALAPAAAGRLEALVQDTVTELLELPDEAGHVLHGDFKCDNILVEDDQRLVLLDFDRVTVGDPALDVGKLSADLRWWGQTQGRDAADLVGAFLDGYGPCPPARHARARHYDVLFQLRAVGRRIPLHEAGWVESVDVRLETAERTRGNG